MAFTFRPGNIIVDENSDFGHLAHGNHSGTPAWPDNNLWLARVRAWLDEIRQPSGGVGAILLECIESHRPANTVVRIVRHAKSEFEAWTDGPLQPGGAMNPTRFPTVYVTFTPQGARRQPYNAGDPMKHPGSVLVHELTHVYMSLQGLNSIRTPSGSVRKIATWSSPAYPNHNEFCATTIQNMHLSENETMLSDGYNHDDPAIVSRRILPQQDTRFGMRASTRIDMNDFLRRYEKPLQFMTQNMPRFTRRLAGLSNIQFNPFAAMQPRVRGR